MKKVSTRQYVLFLFYLSMLSMLGFIATDMYLPAFKAIETSFNTSSSSVAISLTTFLAGLACGQLVYGPLVNRIGHRNALFLGLIIFGIASFVIAQSQSIWMMNCARFFQALGACSANVIWQALVIEQHDSDEAQSIFSNIMPLVALSPALAPILGAFVQVQLGWRAIFIVLAIIAILLILLTQIFVPSQQGKLDKTLGQSAKFLDIIKNRIFLGNVIIFGACSGAFFAYLTLWPIVMEQQGYTSHEIGLSFIPQTILFIIGGYSGKLLYKKLGAEKTLSILLSIFAICVLGIFLFTSVLSIHSIYPLLSVFSILAAANGATYPIVVNNALSQFKSSATKAAGIQNFIQISLSFGASSLVALFASYGASAIGWGILVCGGGVLIGYMLKANKGINPAENLDSMRKPTQ